MSNGFLSSSSLSFLGNLPHPRPLPLPLEDDPRSSLFDWLKARASKTCSSSLDSLSWSFYSCTLKDPITSLTLKTLMFSNCSREKVKESYLTGIDQRSFTTASFSSSHSPRPLNSEMILVKREEKSLTFSSFLSARFSNFRPSHYIVYCKTWSKLLPNSLLRFSWHPIGNLLILRWNLESPRVHAGIFFVGLGSGDYLP